MKYGVHLFATESSINPGEFAREAESRGFESAWFSEHTHIPVGFLEAGSGERKLPDYYWQTFDPFIAAALAASETEKIKLGTGVSLVLEHDPIALAKTVATVDQVSGGRFIFGVGPGWLEEEMANHGVHYATRYKQIAEYLAAIKAIWTEDEPEFEGNFLKFSKMKAYPKPVQVPHPPVIGGGGAGPRSLEMAAKHCSGWMPILGNLDWRGIKTGISKLQSGDILPELNESAFEFSIFCWAPPDEPTTDDMQNNSVEKIIISLEASPRDAALKLMDEYAQLIN
jgi:probable F420-dependent oxidoreductase